MADIFNQTFGSSQPFNETPQTPDHKDMLDLFERNLKLQINCHAIGTIQTFDPITQTATVVMAYQKTFYVANQITGILEATPKPYPVLASVPVIVMGGGGLTGGAITFPIAAGDDCLLMFNDRDIDNWFAGSSGGTVNSNRLHSFADAIAIVGLRSVTAALPNYDASNVVLRNGTTTLTLTNDGKMGVVNLIGEFVALLLTVLTDIQSATAGGYPLVSANLAADLLKLQSFKR